MSYNHWNNTAEAEEPSTSTSRYGNWGAWSPSSSSSSSSHDAHSESWNKNKSWSDSSQVQQWEYDSQMETTEPESTRSSWDERSEWKSGGEWQQWDNSTGPNWEEPEGAGSGSDDGPWPMHWSDEEEEEEADENQWHNWGQAFHDLVLCPCLPPSSSTPSRPRYSLIFLHACSHGPTDVLSFLPELWKRGFNPQDFRIVAPCSPQRVLHGKSNLGNSWYDYTTDRCWRGIPDKVQYEQFVEQRARILRFLEAEHQQLAPGGRMVVGGISQGGSLAIDVMLHAPEHIDSLRGCFSARSMMQQESLYNLPSSKVQLRARTCEVLTFHGKDDALVPWKTASKSYQLLTDRGFKVDSTVEKGIGHAKYSEEEMRLWGDFMTRVLYTRW